MFENMSGDKNFMEKIIKIKSKNVDNVALWSVKKAVRFMEQGAYGRAFANFLIFCQFCPNEKRLFKHEIISCLCLFGETLEKNNRYEDLFSLYEQALEQFPEDSMLLTNVGSHLFRLNKLQEAASFYKRAIIANNLNVIAEDRLENTYNSLLERWHFPMLNDTRRNKDYARAIAERIADGCKSVLDVGTGTGIFAMQAVEQSNMVYACELSKFMYDIAVEVFSRENLLNKIKIFNRHSQDLNTSTIGRRIDLVVTEIMDCCFFGEDILATLDHVHKHILNKNGCIIPQGVELFSVAIECEYLEKKQVFKCDMLGYVDAGNLKITSAPEEFYDSEDIARLPGGYTELTEVKSLLKFDLLNADDVANTLSDGKIYELNLYCVSEGDLSAIVVWFDASLTDTIKFSTCIGSGCCWQQSIFEIKERFKVYPSDEVIAHFSLKKYLKLLSVKVTRHSPVPGEKKEKNVKWIEMDKESICYINDLNIVNTFCWSAYQTHYFKSELVVLDMSVFPIYSLQILKIAHDKKLNVKFLVDPDIDENTYKVNLINALCMNNNYNENNYEILFHKEIPDQMTFDVIMLNLVDGSGKLNEASWNNMRNLQLKALNYGGLILPRTIKIYGQIVDSERLLSHSQVVSDANTLGFKIKESMNTFMVRHQQNLIFETLACKKLTEPFLLHCMQTSDECFDIVAEVCCDIIEPGHSTACFYWFNLDFGLSEQKLELNTYDSFFFKQSCFILNNRFYHINEKISIKLQLQNGILNLKEI